MKLTWLTFVRSEGYDPLGLLSFNIYLHYHLLWGLSQCFLLLGRVIVSKWGFKSNAKAQVFAPHMNSLKKFVRILLCIKYSFKVPTSPSSFLLFLFLFFPFNIYIVGSKDLSFYVGFKAPFTNNNASEEEKALGKTP